MGLWKSSWKAPSWASKRFVIQPRNADTVIVAGRDWPETPTITNKVGVADYVGWGYSYLNLGYTNYTWSSLDTSLMVNSNTPITAFRVYMLGKNNSEVANVTSLKFAVSKIDFVEGYEFFEAPVLAATPDLVNDSGWTNTTDGAPAWMTFQLATPISVPIGSVIHLVVSRGTALPRNPFIGAHVFEKNTKNVAFQRWLLDITAMDPGLFFESPEVLDNDFSPAIQALGQAPQFAAIGDSLTQGYGAGTHDTIWTLLSLWSFGLPLPATEEAAAYPGGPYDITIPWIYQATAQLGATYTNMGVQGEYTEEFLARFQIDILDKKPSYVFIGEITNNLLNADESYWAGAITDIGTMIDMALANSPVTVPVVVSTPPAKSGASTAIKHRIYYYNELLKTLCSTKGVQFIDVQPVLGTFTTDDGGYYTANDLLYVDFDDYHINAAGYAVLGAEIWKQFYKYNLYNSSIWGQRWQP